MPASARKTTAPNPKVELYEALIATLPKLERKGDANPYTSVNGNMFTLLHQSSRLAIRPPGDKREEFVKYKTTLFEAYGCVMKEYVAVPDAMLKNTKELKKHLEVSYEYAKTLKPKASGKKSWRRWATARLTICPPDCGSKPVLSRWNSHIFCARLPPSFKEAFMAQETLSGIVRKASNWSILWGVLLIVLGVMAVGSPMIAAVAVNVVVAWLVVLAGVAHLALAFHARGAGSVIWRTLVGLAYVAFGVYLVAHPLIGVASLTLVLGSLFLVEGVLDIALFFQLRAIARAGWFLLDGIVTLLLGLMIYLQWPSSSAWAIGTLVGVSLIISGVTRVMMSLAVRKAADIISPKRAA